MCPLMQKYFKQKKNILECKKISDVIMKEVEMSLGSF